MPSTYKTPGVYIEEVSKFPPSVAPVATAIPAFIGYTEMAEKNGESLLNKPTKIDSLVEFEQYFGEAPERKIIARIDENNQFLKAEVQANSRRYFLYDSLRLFYANGGGECYIVSVGSYGNAIGLGDITDPITNPGIMVGLMALEKFDEPTLILCPDAALLDGIGLYTFQQQALKQCADLQDRFLIADLLDNDETVNGETFDDRVADFRTRIGINHLKYGAAYAPYLITSLNPFLTYRDILFAKESTTNPDANSSRALLQSLTTDPALTQLIYDIQNAVDAVNSMEGLTDSIPDDSGTTISENLKALYNEFKTDWDQTSPVLELYSDFSSTLQALYVKIREILDELYGFRFNLPNVLNAISVPSGSSSVDFKLRTDIEDIAGDTVGSITALITSHRIIADAALSNSVIELLPTGTASGVPPTTPLDRALSMFGYNNINEVPINVNVAAEYSIVHVVNTVLQASIINEIITPAADAAAVLAGLEALSLSSQQVSDRLSSAKSAAASTAAEVLAEIPLTDINGTTASAFVSRFNLGLADDTAPDSKDAVPSSIPASVFSAINKALNDIIIFTRSLQGTDKGPINDFVASLIATAGDEVRVNVLTAGNIGLSYGNEILTFFNSIQSAARTYESTFDGSLKEAFGLYKTLLNRSAQEIMVLPPSGAIAGIYTAVDGARGVWKAPANVSLSSVIAPKVNINAKDQEALNVDVNAGKSINAIRNFTGKGVLVWGARTLAGNDNEWRYVSVRRFFNFAEESIKKATEQFVFEPNDANTWVRVKAMIENFLILQWRAGALAGAKPEQAFFVKVGLGETMTSIDILEGRMIVEIGMAVVRPAEFIILRFSHKMQEA